MNTVEITQRIEFPCCYILKTGSSCDLCAYRYKFEATVACSENVKKTGRVISFEEFEDLCKQSVPSGCFIYNNSETSASEIDAVARAFRQCGIRCIPLDGEVSAERLINQISLVLASLLSESYPGVKLVETKLRESSNSFVTWQQER